MKKIFSKTGFTLIELIVASLLVIIVILGIVSINGVLVNNNQDYGQRYLVRSGTQITLNNILNNAALAKGSANCDDEAILIGGGSRPAACGGGGNGVTDPNTFCIHQGANNNQINASSDIWLCYSWIYPGNPSDSYTPDYYKLVWCAVGYQSGVRDPRGAGMCYGSTPAPGGYISLPSSFDNQFLGTTYTAPTATFINSGGQSLFSVTITNYLNNTGSTSDPVNNPGVTLSGSVIPLQASSS